MSQQPIIVRPADPSEFGVASEFWIAMYRELKMLDSSLAANWKERSIGYFHRRHNAGELRWFLALDGQTVVGSAGGFLLDNHQRAIGVNRRTGYVAGVYVLPGWRRRGIAREVTRAAVDWLWSIGCEAIRLHAADNARQIYERMGFTPSNEMLLVRRA